MGLFDKKYCDVCGEKIGLLGNRKLEDGNLCKACAAKLSPFFSGRRNATVEEIKAQLAYREENRQKLSSFRATRTYGEGRKVYIDEAAGTFLVTGSKNWTEANPDLISLSQVTACNTDIRENRTEIYRKTEDGKQESYKPPRYEFSYEFRVEILVNSPWFSEIDLELSEGNRPDSKYAALYRQYEQQMSELSNLLLGRGVGQTAFGASVSGTGRSPWAAAAGAAVAGTAAASVTAAAFGMTAVSGNSGASESWKCACGATVNGKFCPECGAKKPEPQPAAGSWQCACGATVNGKFCPQCGAKKPETQSAATGTWKCACGATNTGSFCEYCGSRRPQAQRSCQCSQCGWKPAAGEQPPRFCPECGTPFNNL